jgi:hypothetical protein
MTSIQLLKETEAAAGGEELLGMHTRLIELNQKQVSLGHELDRIRYYIETLKSKNQIFERDVTRIRDRERDMEKVRRMRGICTSISSIIDWNIQFIRFMEI